MTCALGVKCYAHFKDHRNECRYRAAHPVSLSLAVSDADPGLRLVVIQRRMYAFRVFSHLFAHIKGGSHSSPSRKHRTHPTYNFSKRDVNVCLFR